MSLTINAVPRFKGVVAGENQVQDSNISDDGSNVTLSIPLVLPSSNPHIPIIGGDYTYNKSALVNWLGAIYKMRENPSTNYARMVFIGDSWGTHASRHSAWIWKLHAKYGCAGHGYVPLGVYGFGASTYNTVSTTGTWTDSYFAGDANVGVSLSATSTSDTGTPASKSLVAKDCDKFVIHYLKSVGGGVFRYNLNGGSWTNVDTNAADGIGFETTALATYGINTLNIELVSGSVKLFGVESLGSRGGVRLYNIAVSGGKASNYNSTNQTYWRAGMAQLNPHLTVISFGVNDKAAFTVAQYISNITTLVANVKTACPNTDIAFFSQTDVTTEGSLGPYVAALKSYALANNYGYVDNYALIPSYTAGNAAGLYQDGSHLNKAGDMLIAAREETFLTPDRDRALVLPYGGENKLGQIMQESATAVQVYPIFNSVQRNGSLYIGENAGLNVPQSNTGYNLSIGYATLSNVTTGYGSVALGYGNLQYLTTGIGNTALGKQCLANTTTGGGNVAVGYQVLAANIVGANNVGIGYNCLNVCTSSGNVAVGAYAGQLLVGGDKNILIGYQSGFQVTTDSYNTLIGYLSCRYFVGTAGLNTVIGNGALNQAPGSVFTYNTIVGENSFINSFGITSCTTIGAKTYHLGPSSPTLTAAAGGSIDAGLHYWAVTYVVDGVETLAPNEAHLTVAAGSQTINITNISLYTGPGTCTARNIYRTKAGGLTTGYFLLTTIADNTTTTYSDTTADSGLGAAVNLSLVGSIAIGRECVITANYQCLIGGGGTYGITEAYFGNGVYNASPKNITLNATGGQGTNTAGASLTIAGGKGTGTGLGGAIIFSNAPAGSSGTKGNALVEQARITASVGMTMGVATNTVVLKRGSNGKCGTFIANGATPVTVSNTSIAITDCIIISLNTVGGTVGAVPAIQTITAATGFTVAATAGDTSTYNYAIISNAA